MMTVHLEGDEAAVTDSDDSGVSSDSGAEPVGRGSRPSRLAWVVLAVAVVVLVTGAFAWQHVDHDPARSTAETRDAVLIAATQHIETMNTLDYRSIDKGLAAWASVTTGTLHDQLAQVDASERKLLADQKKISTGKVVDAAVTELTDTTATVIAAVEVTVHDDSTAATAAAAPAVKRNRFSANLVKVGGVWKLENLQQVAVSLS